MDSISQSKQIKMLWGAVMLLSLALATALFLLNHTPEQHATVAPDEPVPESVLLPDPWDGLPLQEKIERADAIVIARLELTEGQLTAIATDVLVLKPGAQVLYRVGEEVPLLSRPAGTSTDWGDGAVALLTGSPASIRESYGIHGNRIPRLGDMRLEEFKQMVATR